MRPAALSRASDFAEPDPKSGDYSGLLKHGVEDYFKGREVTIDSIESLNKNIEAFVRKVPDLHLLWRGARSVTWGAHSSLFRHLMRENDVRPPTEAPQEPQNYPDEDQMVRAEAAVLDLARKDWRFDGMSALEIFARMQHFGGPTRLLDITLNPYVAAWFAVEENGETEDHDSRLLAFATEPRRRQDDPPVPPSQVSLGPFWGGYLPAWHGWHDNATRQKFDWGTGARRWYWIPPAYQSRIPVQNAGFLLDGVPITSNKMSSYFKPHTGRETSASTGLYYRRADLLSASSIYLKADSPARKPSPRKSLAPTFAFRIHASAKEEIRNYLETRFGFRRSYIYPDMEGLAQHLRGIKLGD